MRFSLPLPLLAMVMRLAGQTSNSPPRCNVICAEWAPAEICEPLITVVPPPARTTEPVTVASPDRTVPIGLAPIARGAVASCAAQVASNNMPMGTSRFISRQQYGMTVRVPQSAPLLRKIAGTEAFFLAYHAARHDPHREPAQGIRRAGRRQRPHP